MRAQRGITSQPGTNQLDAPEGAHSLGEGSHAGLPQRIPCTHGPWDRQAG